ncbi:MAG: hypothetical protein IH946_09110 [Bacteroidetes bacterium]|nr:hypothetical protein [Bacteroidota bacterium]
MKQVTIDVLLVAAGSYLLSLFLPWWCVIFVALPVAYLHGRSALLSFTTSFLAVFLVAMLTAYYIDVQNDSILSSRIGTLIGLESPLLLYLISGLVLALPAGLGGLIGFLIHPKQRHTEIKIEQRPKTED